MKPAAPSRFESGYLLEVPLLLMVLGMVSALVLPALSLPWQKAYIGLVTVPVLLGLYYTIVIPGWAPGGRLSRPWALVLFSVVATVIVAGVVLFLLA
jgi:hypothetical protein